MTSVMELKKGSQTSKPEKAEVSLNVEGAAVPELSTTGSRSNSESDSRISTDDSICSGSRSNSESVPEDDDPEEIDNSRTSTDASILSDNSRISTEKDKEYDVSNEAICKLEEYCHSSSSFSTPRISDVTHESSIPNQQPPIQVMDRRESFDSKRIPSSIFAHPNASVVDWSIVSNESLFSIQIGKGSISIDPAFILDLDNSQVFSINEGSYSFKDLNKTQESEPVKESGDQLGISKKPIPKEKPRIRISDEPIVNRHHRSTSTDGTKMKMGGFGNGKPNQALSDQKSPESTCSNCGCCTLCHCFSICSCCSCKCFSFPSCGCGSWPSCRCGSWPRCGCGSWPSCSCKSSCWSSCSSCCCKPSTWECCKCKWLTWSIGKIFCCCKPSTWECCKCRWPTWSIGKISCCCKPSTWECCKCRWPTWSIGKIFCCLSSKSSAKFPSRSKKDKDTDAKNWWSCFSCC